jgi:hypothetical protein
MDINTRELFGLGKDDHWGYVAFALILVAFLVRSAPIVVLLIVLGTGFLGLYLVRSTRRLLTSTELSRLVKRVGILVNLVGLLVFFWLVLKHYVRLAG